MATIKDLKELSRRALEAHQKYERRIQAIKDKRNPPCLHKHVRIVPANSAISVEGCSVIENLVCADCGAVVARHTFFPSTLDWVALPGVDLAALRVVQESNAADAVVDSTISEQTPDVVGEVQEEPADPHIENLVNQVIAETNGAPAEPKTRFLRIIKRSEIAQ